MSPLPTLSDAVATHARLNPDKLGARALTHSEISAVIAGVEFRATLDSIRADLSIEPGRYVLMGGPPCPGWTGYEGLIEQAAVPRAFEPVHPDETCADANMPRTATGKIVHRLLRQRLVAQQTEPAENAPAGVGP